MTPTYRNHGYANGFLSEFDHCMASLTGDQNLLYFVKITTAEDLGFGPTALARRFCVHLVTSHVRSSACVGHLGIEPGMPLQEMIQIVRNLCPQCRQPLSFSDIGGHSYKLLQYARSTLSLALAV